jgi:hypothetical protein
MSIIIGINDAQYLQGRTPEDFVLNAPTNAGTTAFAAYTWPNGSGFYTFQATAVGFPTTSEIYRVLVHFTDINHTDGWAIAFGATTKRLITNVRVANSWQASWNDADDAVSLNGYSSNTGTTANTIPVRNGDGNLPGSITGNAATATNAADSALLDGYNTSTGTDASTIPVRNGAGALPGDITGNAPTASEAADANALGGIDAARYIHATDLDLAALPVIANRKNKVLENCFNSLK